MADMLDKPILRNKEKRILFPSSNLKIFQEKLEWHRRAVETAFQPPSPNRKHFGFSELSVADSSQVFMHNKIVLVEKANANEKFP